MRDAGLLLTLLGTPLELPRGPLQVPGPQDTGPSVVVVVVFKENSRDFHYQIFGIRLNNAI